MSFLSYIKKWSLFFLPVSLFFACSDEISTADDEYTVFPDNDYFFSYAPNDYAANDSISANLTHGVKLMVHPKASYELSFKKDPSVSDVPELQLFHLYLNEDSTAYYGKKIRSLHPVENNGRYVYNFDCEEKDIAEWATSLSVDGEFYKGRTDSVRWIGRGSFSDHFSLNLIVVGEHTLTSDDVGAEELARKTLLAFRRYYTSVTVDTIYIRYANEHPTLGDKYPADEPWLAGRSSEDMFLYELGGWPENGVREALDIVYVYRIERDMTIGYASLFSGNLGGGRFSTVLVGNHVMVNGDPKNERLLSSGEIVETILHETGHFFGLRHTTSTMNDFAVSRDASIIEDGLEDTPVCMELLQRKLMKQPVVESPRFQLPVMPGNVYERIYWASSDAMIIASCPDASNFMFPASLDEPFEGFSEQQLDIIRRNLMLFPH